LADRAINCLAEALAATRFEALSGPLAARAADCVLDALGAAAGGLSARSSRAMAATFLPRAGAGSASVWFSERRCDPISAATVNAMAGTALDVDDGHRRAAGHPGIAVISAALAMAEEVDASVGDLLTATVVGYEAAVRVALARVPAWHDSTVSGRWSGVGSAAAAAWLLRLPAPVLAQAMLIAEQHAPRTASARHHGFAGSDVKEAIAWSVQTGLLAVELARNGFEGYPDTFEQRILYDPGALCSNLDQFDAISGLFFKPYACCRWMHSAIDGLAALMARTGLHASAIDAVTVRTFDQAVGLGNHVAPQSEAEAQFSIPFCLGAVAVHGVGVLTPLDPSLLANAAVIDFAKKVRVEPAAEMNAVFPGKAPAIIEILAGGEVFLKHVDAAFGDPTNPLRREDLQRKLTRLAEGQIPAEQAERIMRALETASDRPARRVREALSGALR